MKFAVFLFVSAVCFAQTATDTVHLNIDSPSPQSFYFTGAASFGGWAVADITAISSVSASIDGTPIGNATYGNSRTDVCAVYPNGPGCPNVGWNIWLDTTKLANGQHSLSITATSAGNATLTQSANFFVLNAAAGAPGRGIASATINSQGHLILTLTDGTTQDAGSVGTPSCTSAPTLTLAQEYENPTGTLGPVNGTNTIFTLAFPPSSAPAVFVNGQKVRAGIDYSISARTLTFSSAAKVPLGTFLEVDYWHQ